MDIEIFIDRLYYANLLDFAYLMVLSICIAIAAGVVANRKNRPEIAWGMLTFMIAPTILILLALRSLPPIKRVE